MLTYEKKSLIECQIEELFTFHLDINNLKAISPKGVKVTLLSQNFIPKEGEIMRLKVVKNFIPIIWEVKIETVAKPNLLVDVAIKSPFKFWRHSHTFKQVDQNFCELKDVVEYALPIKFLSIFFEGFIHSQLEAMFEFRHHITKTKLEKKDTLC